MHEEGFYKRVDQPPGRHHLDVEENLNPRLNWFKQSSKEGPSPVPMAIHKAVPTP
jgi:hypothetical protein